MERRAHRRRPLVTGAPGVVGAMVTMVNRPSWGVWSGLLGATPLFNPAPVVAFISGTARLVARLPSRVPAHLPTAMAAIGAHGVMVGVTMVGEPLEATHPENRLTAAPGSIRANPNDPLTDCMQLRAAARLGFKARDRTAQQQCRARDAGTGLAAEGNETTVAAPRPIIGSR
jgi:hypothetical protein